MKLQRWADDGPVGEPIAVNNPTHIGRYELADISCTDDEYASKFHAKISLIPGLCHECWLIEDVGSMNGTFVNEEIVYSEPLKDGDIIRCGRTSWRVDLTDNK